MTWVVLVAAWLGTGIVLVIASVGIARLMGPIGAWRAMRYRGVRLAAQLPTSAPITGYCAAYSPPVRLKHLVVYQLLGIPFVPLGDLVTLVMFQRRHSEREVVLTADGTLWVLRRAGRWRHTKQVVLVGQEPSLGWRPTRIGWALVEGVIAGEPLSLLPSRTTTDLRLTSEA
jgi:hypothetical protein